MGNGDMGLETWRYGKGIMENGFMKGKMQKWEENMVDISIQTYISWKIIPKAQNVASVNFFILNIFCGI